MRRDAFLMSCMVLATACGLAFAGEVERFGLPQDWSHNYVGYNPKLPTEPMTEAEHAAWMKNWKDPRFVAAVLRKADREIALQEAAKGAALEKNKPADPHNSKKPGPAPGSDIHRDWSNVLGGPSGFGVLGTYPAKYSFDVNATPSCANDFVVYITGATGATGTTGTGAFAQEEDTFNGTPTNGQTLTIANGTRTLVITASTSDNTGFNFQVGGSNSVEAQNLADAIQRNGGTVGVTSFANGAKVDIVSETPGPSAITIVSTLNGFAVVSPLPGGTGFAPGQPTIMAFNNLYKGATTATPPGCGGVSGPGRVPNVMWSYNTGNTSVSSPVLSLDGTQVAFTDTDGTTASIVLLKWAANTGTAGNPAVPTLAGSAAAYRSCAAPCMYKITMTGSNNTNSSVYYDYDADIAYVGSADGRLWKFNGVFLGTPAAAGSPWPVTVSAGNALSSPVVGAVTGKVWVGSARGASTGGQLHSVNSTTGVVESSAQLAANNSVGIGDSPFVDSFALRVYAFTAMDNTTVCSGGRPCQSVYQFVSNVSVAGSSGIAAKVGVNDDQPQRYLKVGAFGGIYWDSPDPSNPTGFLYVCGSPTNSSSGRKPTLYRVPITNNTMSTTPVIGPDLTSNAANECSPMTLVSNGPNDYLYVSVRQNGNLGNGTVSCQTLSPTGSCLYMFQISNAVTWGTSVTPTAVLAVSGGTTGIIMDNVAPTSTTPGASQVYFTNLSNPGNAVQASQAGLN